MEWLANPETWVGLLTLTVLEIILGTDVSKTKNPKAKPSGSARFAPASGSATQCSSIRNLRSLALCKKRSDDRRCHCAGTVNRETRETHQNKSARPIASSTIR